LAIFSNIDEHLKLHKLLYTTICLCHVLHTSFWRHRPNFIVTYRLCDFASHFSNKSHKPCKHDSYPTNDFLKMKLYIQPVHHPLDKNDEMHPKLSPQKYHVVGCYF
ncbi:hypothetical protein GIB67_041819, partial [Kingdonia uniflora]